MIKKRNKQGIRTCMRRKTEWHEKEMRREKTKAIRPWRGMKGIIMKMSRNKGTKSENEKE